LVFVAEKAPARYLRERSRGIRDEEAYRRGRKERRKKNEGKGGLAESEGKEPAPCRRGKAARHSGKRLLMSEKRGKKKKRKKEGLIRRRGNKNRGQASFLMADGKKGEARAPR